MRSISISYIVLLACLGSVLSATPPQWENVTVDQATEFSLIYGYPLIPYTEFALPILGDHDATNQLQHMRSLATPSSQAVVRPNVDTLYSQAVIDLSHNDLVIEVPNITDRYWVFPFYDVYGNNYANLGSLSNSPAGKYQVRYANPVHKQAGVQMCEQACQGYQGYINAPTPYGSFVGRILVMNNGTDLQTVHSLQNQTELYSVPLTSRQKGQKIPSLTTNLLNSSLSNDLPTRIMELTSRIAPYNPPRNISDLPRVSYYLKKAGITDGQYRPTAVNLTQLANTAVTEVFAYAAEPQNQMDLGNGWMRMIPAAQGDYGTDYEIRYYVAYEGYLALTANQALYPIYFNGGSSKLTLGPNQAYTVTFNSKPPLTDQGFWSITAYNTEGYLIANSLDRYAVGDRSNLTYADGTPVYGSGSKNESFQILLQPANVTPPTNWTSNWLPAPAGGGNFSITFRLYAPSSALIDGQWLYPVVEKQDAITA